MYINMWYNMDNQLKEVDIKVKWNNQLNVPID